MPDDPSRSPYRRQRPTVISAEAAGQGRIVLNTPLRRGVFIAGLVGIVLPALFIALLQ
ncbi:MAG TPA: hypothetical protein VD978_19075 [Azospirillum sp.]|nr:hypothetical protein [Azospirillum sp.]